jgi:hypothetical protein
MNPLQTALTEILGFANKPVQSTDRTAMIAISENAIRHIPIAEPHNTLADGEIPVALKIECQHCNTQFEITMLGVDQKELTVCPFCAQPLPK